jgi:hypothetical protein
MEVNLFNKKMFLSWVNSHYGLVVVYYVAAGKLTVSELHIISGKSANANIGGTATDRTEGKCTKEILSQCQCVHKKGPPLVKLGS